MNDNKKHIDNFVDNIKYRQTLNENMDALNQCIKDYKFNYHEFNTKYPFCKYSLDDMYYFLGKLTEKMMNDE